MIESYNCLRLDNGYVFQVEVYEEEKNKKYFEINGRKTPYEELKIGQLAKLISHEGKFKDSDTLNLWQVDVDNSKLIPSFIDDNIKDLGGVLMERQYNFIKYLNDSCKITFTLLLPLQSTTAGKCLIYFHHLIC